MTLSLRFDANRKKKTNYIQCRISDDSKKIIEKGAMLLGLDVSDYIRINILKIAQNDIANASLNTAVTLTENGWNNFVRIMEEPFVRNKKLQSAFDKLREIEDL